MRRLLLALLLIGPGAASAQVTTAFTYQGELEQSGSPADGTFDLRFRLFDTPSSGGPATAGPVFVDDMPVAGGLFTALVDFGPDIFGDADLWLEVSVRDGDSTGAYTILSPRQLVTPSPAAQVSLGVAPDSIGTDEVAPDSLTGADLEDTLALGATTSSTGTGAFSTGVSSSADGPAATAMGFGTEALTDAATAMGRFTDATGLNSTAMGLSTVASGDNSTAMGSGSEASGEYSVAAGLDCTVTGEGSVAFGKTSEATGFYAIAAGLEAKANGHGAVALGRLAEATADDAVALGLQATATHANSFSFNGSTTDTYQFIIAAPNGVGIGTDAPRNQLDVRRNESGSATTANHVAVIENLATNDGDVLALKSNTGNPDSQENFITFKDANSNVGAIEGNGSNGIVVTSGGADFAELLPVAPGATPPQPGDVVGVVGGRATLETAGAHRLMVVTDRPVVLGNAPGDRARNGQVPVAFVGQVPVRVRGPATAGDVLVASGLDDGTARAVAARDWRPGTHGPAIGRAWSGSQESGVHRVTAAVGLGSSGAAEALLLQQRSEIRRQEARIERLERRLLALEENLRRSGGS